MASAFNGELPNRRLQRTPVRTSLSRKPFGWARNARGVRAAADWPVR
jgi:hypothetical protein